MSRAAMLSPRHLPPTPLETIRTSSQNSERFRSTSQRYDEMMIRDEEGKELPVIWGRTGPPPGAALSLEINVVSRSSQSRSRVHIQRPSTREPLRQLEDRTSALPVLRDAVASEWPALASPSSLTPRARTAGSPSPGVSLWASATPPPTTFSTTAQHFGKGLLQRHCGRFMLESLEEAENIIGALRLEIDLLRRINETLTNPGQRSDGETNITPYTFSEENFQILYLENAKLRELLQANIHRYDETNLAFIQKTKDHARQEEEVKKLHQQMVEDRMKQASLEQQLANVQFKHDQIEKSYNLTETARLALQSEFEELQEQLTALRTEHQLCTAFKQLMEEEREAVRSELDTVRKDLIANQNEKERILSTCAALEGKLLVQLEQASKHRTELQKVREDKEAMVVAQMKTQEELSTARIQLVQADGTATRLQRDLENSDQQLTRVNEELMKLRANLSADANTITTMKEESDATISSLKEQLARNHLSSLSHAEKQLHTLETVQSQMVELGKDHAIVKEENERLRQENHVLRAQQEELRDSIASLEAQSAKLKQELKVVRAHEEEGRSSPLKKDRAPAGLGADPTGGSAAASPSHPSPVLSSASSALHSNLPSAPFPSSSFSTATSPAVPLTQSEHDKYLHRIRELELRVREVEQNNESQRRLQEQLQAKLTRAEHESEREANLRRIQLKSAKEIRKRLESHVSVLDLRCGALTKALSNLGEKGQKLVQKLAPHEPTPVLPLSRGNSPQPYDDVEVGTTAKGHPSASSLAAAPQGEVMPEVRELRVALEGERAAHQKTKRELKALQAKLETQTHKK